MVDPGLLAHAYHYVIMVIRKLAYPGTTDDIVNISLLHPRFIGSCNYQPKQMERKGMLPSFVLFRSICPNMVDLVTYALNDSHF